MHEYISIEVLLNWVSMLRADVNGAIWLSDDADETFFYLNCAHETATVIPAPQVAVSVLRRVEERGLQGVVATSRGKQPPHDAPNVFQPSLGDVASLLMLSKAFDKVATEVCGNPWLTACQKEVGQIRQRVMWIARVIEGLRQVCAREGVHPPDTSDPCNLIDWSTFEPAWDRLSPVLITNGLSKEALKEIQAMRPSKDIRADLLECDGMDAVRILAAATQMYRPRGIPASSQAGPARLTSMLRLAFDLTEFEADEVFWRMKQWEWANLRYPLLRKWRTLDPLGTVCDQRYWEPDLTVMLRMLKPGEPFAIFQIDLDNFKAVNTKLGQAGGDEALRLYCELLQTVFAGVGEVYRRGGDEVLVLAPGLPEGPARDLAEQARARVEEAFRSWAAEHDVHPAPTASIGLVLTTAEKSRSDIIHLVDQAQLAAKQQGKNRVTFLS
jgi:diguanylate cyclase (GGDEF)-like protein